jgi:hypothetical protein
LSNPGARQQVGNPILPCRDLDVEVISDVIEELDDIEVIAEPKEEPEPDVEVVAVVDEGDTAGRASADDEEPDYDVDVACEVQDAEEPDLELTFSTTGDSNDAV